MQRLAGRCMRLAVAGALLCTFATVQQAQSVTRVSIAELQTELASGASPIVLFTSDDPDCSFCVNANADVPERIARTEATLPIRMVSWSPWRTFPSELATLPLAAPIGGVPLVVRFRGGREG